MAYHDRLAQAWRDHLAPRAPDAPTVVSLFAGAGGSSLGYSMAGFDERLAVEWDDTQATTFKTNFPDVPLFHADIATLTDDEALRLARVAPGELDVLDGSPPCQGFSQSGQRAFADGRNRLFLEYARLLRAYRPRAFVMENVSGMLVGKMKPIFAAILQELESSGYRVSARLLVAGHYGIPQYRRRLIFIGIRDDLAQLGIVPSHPAPTSWPVTIREAFFGVVNTQADRDEAAHSPGITRDVILRLKPGQLGSALKKGHYYNHSRLAWDWHANGVMKSSYEINHPEEVRRLTIKEVQRIGSFPDPFVLVGTFKERWAAVGNCVPPLFMRAIARHVRSLLSQIPADEGVEEYGKQAI